MPAKKEKTKKDACYTKSKEPTQKMEVLGPAHMVQEPWLNV